MKSTAACVKKVVNAFCGSTGSSVKSEIASSDVPWDSIDWTEDHKVENETNTGLRSDKEAILTEVCSPLLISTCG